MEGVLIACVMLSAGVALAAVTLAVYLVRTRDTNERRSLEAVARALDVARQAPSAHLCESIDHAIKTVAEQADNFADKALSVAEEARVVMVQKHQLLNQRAALELDLAAVRGEIARGKGLKKPEERPEELRVNGFSDTKGGDRGAPV